MLVDGISGGKVRDLGREMGRWRTIKSVDEQKVLRKAANLSAHAHTKVSSSSHLTPSNILIHFADDEIRKHSL